jgi:hypothetical protein
MTTIDFSPRQILLGLFFVCIVLYSLFQGRFVILGPNIRIDTPKDGASVTAPVTISGHADNVAYISLDDRPIFTDDHGNWSEQLIASPGLSIITVRAKDRFGRQKVKTLEIVIN